MFKAVNETQPKAFDPNFAVKRSRTPYDKDIYPALDDALAEGDKYMQKFVASIPSDEPMVCRRLSVIYAIRDWLDTNKYLVIPTDKNLGCCVVSAEWAINCSS